VSGLLADAEAAIEQDASPNTEPITAARVQFKSLVAIASSSSVTVSNPLIARAVNPECRAGTLAMASV
jgi:hypothetical protein